MQVRAIQRDSVGRRVAHHPESRGYSNRNAGFNMWVDFGKMGIERIQGRLHSGVFENYIFPITAMGGRSARMPDDPIHGGKYNIACTTPCVSFQREKIQSFMELISIVPYASVSTGGNGFFRARLL